MVKETYNRLLGEILNEIQEISKEIDFNNLTCYFRTASFSPINFIKFKGSFGFFKEIKNDNISLKKVEEEQNEFKSNLGEITFGNPKHKGKYHLNTIKYVKKFYNSRQKIIDLFNDNAKTKSEGIYKKNQDGTGLKILTHNQMLQRFPIALA